MANANIFNFNDTWNDAGTTFSAIKVNVTDTASQVDSTLIDLEVGGVSQASVTKAGEVICKGLTSSQNIDLQGNRLVMDADSDTYLESTTDDRLDVVVGGTLVARFDAGAADTFQLDGVGFSPTGAVVGQALGFPNSDTTVEPYTPAGAGDLLAAANETVTGNWTFTGDVSIGDGTSVAEVDFAINTGSGQLGTLRFREAGATKGAMVFNGSNNDLQIQGRNAADSGNVTFLEWDSSSETVNFAYDANITGVFAGGQADDHTELKARSVSGLTAGDVVYVSDSVRHGFFAWRSGDQSGNIRGGAKTVTAGDAGADTLTISSHGYFTGYKVLTGATGVAGVSADTEYYITRVDADTIQLHTSIANLNAGTAVDVTSATTTGLTVALLKDPAEGEWVTPDSDATGASGAWQRIIDGYYSVRFFGAVGDDSTDNTTAISEAISTLQQKDSELRSLFFPRGIYRISSATVPMVGNQWNVFGEGNQASEIFTSADAPILQLDTREFTSNFFRLDGMYLRGSDSGTDTDSAGLKVLGTTSSATGASFPRITNNYVTGVRVGFDFQDTGKRIWSGDLTLSSHRYLYFAGNNVTPTLACKYGLWFRGAGPADGSQIIGNTLRGSVAALKMGTGATDQSLGDTLICNNHLNGIGDASSLCFELIGPAASGGGTNPDDGNYNQLLNMVNNQMETTHATKCGQFTNLQNWNFVANSFDPTKPPVLTDCNTFNYTGEGLIQTDTVTTGALNVSGAATLSSTLGVTGTATFSGTADFNGSIDTTGGSITDTNGLRHAQIIMSRRNVDNSYGRIQGGASGGGKLDLYGASDASFPNQAFLDVARFRQRSANGATTYIDTDPNNSKTTIGDGAWNGHRLALGSYQLWVDSTGDLRIKNGAPTSDTDGTIVGTQS